jgi:DNA polymerase III delta prime subunit
MSSKEHTLWVEKYRSPNLDSYVGNEQIKNTISKYLGQNDIQNFIFYGPAGTGKTTLAKLIVNNLDCSFLYINASDERGIDTIRDKVQGFSSVASFKPLKVVILDEADFLTIQAQASLRNIIETFARTTRFILTCNYIERIIDPLQSRCQVLKIVPPSKQEIAYHIIDILKNENVGMGADDLKLVVNQYYPDIRKMLNTLQMGVAGDEILIDKNILVSSNYKTKVLAELIKPNSKSFNNIRQIVADSGVSDYEDLFRYLYDNAEKYAPLSVGEVIIYIEEYQYHANFRIDKEINIMALISRILSLISSKRVI